MSEIKKIKSPKNAQLKDITKYQELIIKNPKDYSWNQFITYNNLSRSDIIILGNLSLLEYYFNDKVMYYQDLSSNAENISLDIVKFLTSKKLADDPSVIEMNRKNNWNFDYNVILSFIQFKRAEILEYLYTSEILSENFYISGIPTILNTAITTNDVNIVKIVFRHLPEYVENINYQHEIDPYTLGKDSNYQIYKLVLENIYELDLFWKKELIQGIRDSQVDQKEKDTYRL